MITKKNKCFGSIVKKLFEIIKYMKIMKSKRRSHDYTKQEPTEKKMYRKDDYRSEESKQKMRPLYVADTGTDGQILD